MRRSRQLFLSRRSHRPLLLYSIPYQLQIAARLWDYQWSVSTRHCLASRAGFTSMAPHDSRLATLHAVTCSLCNNGPEGDGVKVRSWNTICRNYVPILTFLPSAFRWVLTSLALADIFKLESSFTISGNSALRTRNRHSIYNDICAC